jgi:hypothetical protein
LSWRDPLSGGAPDDQPCHDKKHPADRIHRWIAVVGGVTKIATDILGWFR